MTIARKRWEYILCTSHRFYSKWYDYKISHQFTMHNRKKGGELHTVRLKFCDLIINLRYGVIYV